MDGTCSVGIFLKEDDQCNKTVYSKYKRLKLISTLNGSDKEQLDFKNWIENIAEETICQH